MIEHFIMLGLVTFGIGFIIAFWIKGKAVSQKVKAAESEAQKLTEEARRKSETLLKEANLEIKDRLFRMKSEFDTETEETKRELKNRDQRLLHKEEGLDRKIEQFDQRDREFTRQEKELARKAEKIERDTHKYNELLEEQRNQLVKISGMTAENKKTYKQRYTESGMFSERMDHFAGFWLGLYLNLVVYVKSFFYISNLVRLSIQYVVSVVFPDF